MATQTDQYKPDQHAFKEYRYIVIPALIVIPILTIAITLAVIFWPVLLYAYAWAHGQTSPFLPSAKPQKVDTYFAPLPPAPPCPSIKSVNPSPGQVLAQ